MIQLDLTIVRFQLAFFHSSAFISNVERKEQNRVVFMFMYVDERVYWMNRKNGRLFLHDNVDK